MPTMPAVFFGHGSPMNTLEHNRYTEAWRAFGASIPRPRAILAISAHWYINATAVTAMAVPRVIHDFYGFPQQLFDFDYPAPGAPEVAEEVVETVKPAWVGLDHDSWGLDHGTWSVLAHMFPDADVPVVQLSVHAGEPAEYHLELGRKLAPLAERGILVFGSGNVVHNLRMLDWGQPEAGFGWAHRFDEHVRELMTTDPDRMGSALEHPDTRAAVPTPDHFLPVLYVAGVASAHGAPAAIEVGGYAYGSLSMTSYRVGGTAHPEPSGAPSASIPADVPPEDTNT
jgi:4,5-DOPA dioxygenase extradiol